MGRLVDQKVHGARVSIAVLACSKGAEVYSILWSIRTSRPDLIVTLQAVDISQEIIDFAKEGAYSLKGPASLNALDYLGMTEEEKLSWIIGHPGCGCGEPISLSHGTCCGGKVSSQYCQSG